MPADAYHASKPPLPACPPAIILKTSIARRPLARSSTMSSFWTDTCNHSQNRTLQQKIDDARGSCSVTVTCAAAAAVNAAPDSLSLFVVGGQPLVLYMPAHCALHSLYCCNMLHRLLRIVSAPSQVASCSIGGRVFARTSGIALGGCTGGSRGSCCAAAALVLSRGPPGCRLS